MMEDNSLFKHRLASPPTLAGNFLVTKSAGDKLGFMITTGDEYDAHPVILGRAEVVTIVADFGGVIMDAQALRLHLSDAEHLGAEAADSTDPRLLALFPDAQYYVLGDDPDVYDVATGKVVGRMLR